MKALLDPFRDREFIGVGELAATAAAILGSSRTHQERGTVTEYPDERTIRYYLSEGLIPPPSEKKGTASVFSYVHLLALLAIKKLQAEHLSIRQIKEILADKDVKELETLLGVDAEDDERKSGRNEAQEYLESLLGAPQRRQREMSGASPPLSPSKPLFSRVPLPSVATPSAAAPLVKPTKAQSWEHFEIADGLELHVEKNYKLPSDSKERSTLIKVIEEIFQLLVNK